MPTYYFACECGKLTEVEPSRAGTAFTCFCGRNTALPSLRHLVRKDMASYNPESQQLEGQTGLKVTAHSHNWKLKSFCVPRVVINGNIKRGSWGTSFFALDPGSYEAEIYFYWLLIKCGRCRIQFRVEREQVPEIDYFAPPFVFAEGELQLRK